jgi:hypothetical protein
MTHRASISGSGQVISRCGYAAGGDRSTFIAEEVDCAECLWNSSEQEPEGLAALAKGEEQ